MSSQLNHTPKMSEIVAWFRRILKTDTQIKTWCLDHYGRAPKLYFGVDMQNAPTEQDTPFITLERDTHTGGPGFESDSYRLISTVALYEDTPVVVDEDGVTIAQGVDRIEELMYLIRDRLDASLPAVIMISDCTLVNEDVNYAPMYVGQLEFTLSIRRCIGGITVIPTPP